jgi:chromatin remodeling complex protein RSC6
MPVTSSTPAKKSSKAAAAAEPKVEKPVAVAPVVEEAKAVAESVTPSELAVAYTEFTGKLTAARALVASIMTDFKALQKRTERDFKTAAKAGNKRRAQKAQRAPSGFVKPTLISDTLADFLSKPKGTLIARTEVTREINAYIRANKLQDPANGRKINPDAKLKKLLALKATDELTYFNLQRYMSPHFQKAAAATTA